MAYPNPDDSPEDGSPPIRARVPDNVAAGQISTGVIVVTGATEFILDFVRNLPMPNMIVARVVLPHVVMPQFIEALRINIDLYLKHFGDLTPPLSHHFHSARPRPLAPPANRPVPTTNPLNTPNAPAAPNPEIHAPINILPGIPVPPNDPSKPPSSTNPTGEFPKTDEPISNPPPPRPIPNPTGSNFPESVNPPRTPPQHAPMSSAQEIYDELKLQDDLLSGRYANAVMIGHGPHEFSFDFITNFFPQSAVSCRVFMAAGHVGRLYDSLKASWDQLRPRLGGGAPGGGPLP